MLAPSIKYSCYLPSFDSFSPLQSFLPSILPTSVVPYCSYYVSLPFHALSLCQFFRPSIFSFCQIFLPSIFSLSILPSIFPSIFTLSNLPSIHFPFVILFFLRQPFLPSVSPTSVCVLSILHSIRFTYTSPSIHQFSRYSPFSISPSLFHTQDFCFITSPIHYVYVIPSVHQVTSLLPSTHFLRQSFLPSVFLFSPTQFSVVSFLCTQSLHPFISSPPVISSSFVNSFSIFCSVSVILLPPPHPTTFTPPPLLEPHTMAHPSFFLFLFFFNLPHPTTYPPPLPPLMHLPTSFANSNQ